MYFACANANVTYDNAKSSVAATSSFGNKLLSNARRLDADEEEDFTWVADYSIKFQSCRTVLQYNAEGAEGGDNDEDASPVEARRLVQFSLCASNSCSSKCSGGDYVVSMEEYVQAYTEYHEQKQEQACETVRETCYCDGDDDQVDDQACEAQCFIDAGLDYCVEDEDGEEEFQIEEYLECREMEINNNNNKYSTYYLGAYCSNDGGSIFLGTFADASCTTFAAQGIYEKFNYGETLPYSKGTGMSLIGNDCISCKQEKDDNDGDQEEEDEVSEMCEQIYEQSGKCETNLGITSPNTAGCQYIHNVIPKLDALYHKVTKSSSASSIANTSTSTILAWTFGMATIGLGAVAFFLRSKAKRANINLSDQGGSDSKEFDVITQIRVQYTD